MGKIGGKIFFISLLAVFLVGGCGTTKKITEDIVGGGRDLKKKVAFMPTVNRTGYGGKTFSEDAMANLETFVKRHCEDVITPDTKETNRVFEEVANLPPERVDNLTLAGAGRTLGVSAIIEETLSDLVCEAEKRGVYGFRDMAPIVWLAGRLRGLDPQTGAILFDEVFEEEIQVGEEDWQNIKERKGYHKEIANRLLIGITDKMGEKVSEKVCSMPWKGYVTKASGDKFTLSSGTDVGLEVGDLLEVFGTSGMIKGPAGQVYMLSGPKIGELQVTEVRKTTSEAIGVQGDNLDKSSYLRLKD